MGLLSLREIELEFGSEIDWWSVIGVIVSPKESNLAELTWYFSSGPNRGPTAPWHPSIELIRSKCCQGVLGWSPCQGPGFNWNPNQSMGQCMDRLPRVASCTDGLGAHSTQVWCGCEIFEMIVDQIWAMRGGLLSPTTSANSSLASPAPNPQVSRLPSLLEPPFGARASPPRLGASSSPAAPRPPHLPTPHVATRCVDGNAPLAPPLTKKTSPRFLQPFPNPSARSSCPKPAHTQPPPSPLSQLAPNSNLTTPHTAPSSSAASAWPWASPRPIAGVDVPWMPMATTVLPAPQAGHCVPEPCQLNEPWPASFVKPGHGSTCTCPWPTWISIRPPRTPGPSKFWHKGSPSTKARSSPSTRP